MNPLIEERIQKAITFHQQDELEQAEAIYADVLKEDPNHSVALHLYGVSLSQRGDFIQGLEFMDRALAFTPGDPAIWSNRAKAYLEAGKLDLAFTSAKQALTINPKFADAWCHAGSVLQRLNLLTEAAQHFTRCIELNPTHYNALKSRAISLQGLGRFADAYADCESAKSIAPHDDEMMMLQASLLFAIDAYGDALPYLKQILQRSPHNAQAIVLYCQCLRNLGMFRENADFIIRVLNLMPGFPWIEGELVFNLVRICDWSEMGRLETFAERVYQGQCVIAPFMAITLFDDLRLIQKISQNYAQNQYNNLAPSLTANPRRERIKIGYYSSDFCNHPMAMLIPEMIESRNRECFEVYLFSLRPSPEDVLRQRLRRAGDHFIEVDHWNDLEVAQKSCEMGIDIAVDLMGYTAKNRHSIFFARCAPVQVSLVGMPCTSGSPAIDYIIADPIVIPESSRQYYTEQVVHLPCYWPNDSKRGIVSQPPTRESFGLPNEGFIFCCFNVSFKILPETFAGWMRILAATPGSVLWLLKTNNEAMENLRKSAESLGIAPERLIFAEKVPVVEHLARHCIVDLSLDSFPCNAHTTAVDALWAGLPLLTRSGQSFASRVAASMLSRIGLPELITDNQADFEARAIYLANEGRSELKAIREKLGIFRKTSPLFDGKAFAKDIEKAYHAIYERSQAGLKPDFISVV